MSDANSGRNAPPDPASPLEAWLEYWVAEIQSRQTRAASQSNVGCLLIAAGIILGGILAWNSPAFLGGSSYAGLGIIVATIAGATLWSSTQGQQLAQEGRNIAAGISRVAEPRDWLKDSIVRLLYEKVDAGKVKEATLGGLDADTYALLNIRGKVDDLFRGATAKPIQAMQITVNASQGQVSSITVEGEDVANRFRTIAAGYLAHKQYVESVAALAMVEMICAEIAPPGGARLSTALLQLDTRLMEAAVSACKVFRSFDFKPEIKAVKDASAQRRARSLVELVVAMGQKAQGDVPQATLATAFGAADLQARDRAFLEACIDYIGKLTVDSDLRGKAWELLALIPDAAVVPYVVRAFEHFAFFPQGIESVAAIGDQAHAPVLHAVKTGKRALRFNAALALGFMKVAEARSTLEHVLPTISEPTESAGVAYALVRLGASGLSQTFLDNGEIPS